MKSTYEIKHKLNPSSYLEPEQREHSPDAHVLLEHLRDWHAGVDQLLTALVADGGHEGGRLADQTKLLFT